MMPPQTASQTENLLRLAMDTEIVDYTQEDFLLGSRLDPNSESILFSTRSSSESSLRPRISSSESSQEMGLGANYFVSC